MKCAAEIPTVAPTQCGKCWAAVKVKLHPAEEIKRKASGTRWRVGAEAVTETGTSAPCCINYTTTYT